MLKSFIGIYLDFICNFCCIKNIACFQNIYFVLKKCSPYSRFSNQTGKIYFIFFGLLFIFLRIIFRGTYLKKTQIGFFGFIILRAFTEPFVLTNAFVGFSLLTNVRSLTVRLFFFFAGFFSTIISDSISDGIFVSV